MMNRIRSIAGTVLFVPALALAQEGPPQELVVCPDAGHGFNLDGRQYRAGDTADAWRRVQEMLAKHHPLNPLK